MNIHHKLHKNIRGFQQNWLTVFYVMNDGLGINDLLKYLYVKMHGKSMPIRRYALKGGSLFKISCIGKGTF